MSIKNNITKLWQRPKISDTESFFEAEFSKEILFSERYRSLFIIIFSIGVIIWFTSISYFFTAFSTAILNKTFMGIKFHLWLILIFSILILYESLYTSVLALFQKRERVFPLAPRFFNALVEISIPTVIIYLYYITFHSIESLFTPVLIIYVILIALSSLRLLPLLCLFTGLTAGAEYIILSSYILNHTLHDSSHSMLYVPGLHFGKGLLLIAAGIITALVAREIKKKVTRSFNTLEEKNRIVSIFGQHVSPEVADTLLQQNLEFSGESRDVTVMFCDIRNFTSFSESRSPEEIVNYLNYLFDFMIEIINTNHGIINKFLGDGFMALFGAPVSEGNDKKHAVQAGIDIVKRLKEEVDNERIPHTEVGIGIHSGNVVAGTMGSSIRKEYTIIGDVVNLASRIEQLNKKFKSSILISEEVRKDIKSLDIPITDIGLVKIRGHHQELRLFKL